MQDLILKGLLSWRESRQKQDDGRFAIRQLDPRLPWAEKKIWLTRMETVGMVLCLTR